MVKQKKKYSQNPKIVLSSKTKDKLNKLKSDPKETYEDVINKKILASGLDLKKIIKPVSIKILEKERPSWSAILLADSGDVLHVASRQGSGSQHPQQVIQIFKSGISAIKILKEEPFELLEDVEVRHLKDRYKDQWAEEPGEKDV